MFVRLFRDIVLLAGKSKFLHKEKSTVGNQKLDPMAGKPKTKPN